MAGFLDIHHVDYHTFGFEDMVEVRDEHWCISRMYPGEKACRIYVTCDAKRNAEFEDAARYLDLCRPLVIYFAMTPFSQERLQHHYMQEDGPQTAAAVQNASACGTLAQLQVMGGRHFVAEQPSWSAVCLIDDWQALRQLPYVCENVSTPIDHNRGDAI